MKAGNTVMISDSSEYKWQAYYNDVKMVGKIIYIREYEDHPYKVVWENGSENVYNKRDLILVNELNNVFIV